MTNTDITIYDEFNFCHYKTSKKKNKKKKNSPHNAHCTLKNKKYFSTFTGASLVTNRALAPVPGRTNHYLEDHNRNTDSVPF